MVTDQWHLMRLPDVWVCRICTECDEHLFVIVNTCFIIDLADGFVGTMVWSMQLLSKNNDAEKTRIKQLCLLCCLFDTFKVSFWHFIVIDTFQKSEYTLFILTLFNIHFWPYDWHFFMIDTILTFMGYIEIPTSMMPTNQNTHCVLNANPKGSRCA